MPDCPACRSPLAEDSRFCGFCGFRLTPIVLAATAPAADLPTALAPTAPTTAKPTSAPTGTAAAPGGCTPASPPLVEDSPVLLTRRKKRPAAAPGTKPEAGQAPHEPAEHGAPERASAVDDEVAAPPEADAQSGTRRRRRFPLKVEVNYTSEHNFYTGFLENISGGGIFIATHALASIGEQLEVSFTVAGLDRLCTATCSVQWIREYNPASSDGVPGMGLRFVQLDLDAQRAIELFLRHREPIFFDAD